LPLEIFKLVGSIFVDNDEANKSIAKTDEHASNLGEKFVSGVKTAGAWGAAITGAATTAVAGVVKLTTESAASMDTIDKMSQKIGVSKEAYQELDYILGQNGIDVNILQSGMKTLVNAMDSASESASGASVDYAALEKAQQKLIAAQTKVEKSQNAVTMAQNNAEKALADYNAALASDDSAKAEKALVSYQNACLKAENAQIDLTAAQNSYTYIQKQVTALSEPMAAELNNQAKLFEKLGVSVSDSEGQLRSQEEVFFDVIAALQGMENETERNAIANDLLGKSATELAPLLNGGAQSMEELRQRAHELGLVFSDDAVNAGVVLGDTIDDLKKSMTAVVTDLGTSLFPIIQQVAEYIIAGMPKIQALFDKIAPVVMMLLEKMLPPLMSLAEKLLPIIFTLIETLIPPIAEIAAVILPILVQLLEMLLPPIIEIVQALLPVFITLLNAFLPILQPILDLLQPLIDVLMLFLEPLMDLINWILPPLVALIQERLAKALGILTPLFEGITKAVGIAVEIFKSMIDFIKNVFVGNWEAAWQNVKVIFAKFVQYLKTIWDTIKKALSGVSDAFIAPFKAAWEGIKKAFSGVEEFFTNVFNTIKGLFKMPHFTFTGSLNPLKWADEGVPKIGVEWYAKGGILNDPTAFGFNPNTNSAMVGGEAGPEAVAPIETLKAYIHEAIGTSEQTQLLNAILMVLKEFNETLYDKIVDAMVNGVRFEIDDREIGRLIRTYA